METTRSIALKNTLMEVAIERGVINPRILGRWIERHAGRHCEGMWFDKAGIRSGNDLWRVKGEPAPDQGLEERE